MAESFALETVRAAVDQLVEATAERDRYREALVLIASPNRQTWGMPGEAEAIAERALKGTDHG